MQHEEILEFISSTFNRTKKNTAVIALSGGIDSTTSLYLTAKAIGPQSIFAYHLPTKTSNPIHLEHSQLAVKAAALPEANFTIIPIGSIIQKSWRIIHRSTSTYPTNQPSDPLINRTRLANLTARIRMSIIFDQAKLHNALVIGTENLSEHMLGYYTRFGDEASDVEPIRHLLKTQVIELAKSLGVPEPIVTKKPSADLWQGQTDAGELGFTYDQADPILALCQQGLSQEEITSQGFDEQLVKAVYTIMKHNDFKHQVPYSLLSK